uniref:Uncharacterized protein n=1 Tax=Mesocestoides corti TaxID=53468 RepID=A0A5K3F1C9_MESCO
MYRVHYATVGRTALSKSKTAETSVIVTAYNVYPAPHAIGKTARSIPSEPISAPLSLPSRYRIIGPNVLVPPPLLQGFLCSSCSWGYFRISVSSSLTSSQTHTHTTAPNKLSVISVHIITLRLQSWYLLPFGIIWTGGAGAGFDQSCALPSTPTSLPSR